MHSFGALDRRAFGASCAALAAVPLAGCATGVDRRAPYFESNGIPIGLQLFPLRASLQENFDATLEQVAAIGYDIVETAGLYGNSAADFRAALDRVGLTCRAMHVQSKPLQPGPNLETALDTVISDAQALGATQIVMPLYFFPEGFSAPVGMAIGEVMRLAASLLKASDYSLMAQFMNERAALLAEHGLRLSYHNHNAEFRPLGDGRSGMDILFAETDPALVDFELDLGWAAAAGVDVESVFAAHPGRIKMLHVKNIDPATPRNYALEQVPALLGEGVLDYARLAPLAHRAGVTGFFIEQEPPFTGPRIEALAANYRYLATLRAA